MPDEKPPAPPEPTKGVAAELERLKQENAALTAELARTQQAVAADKGPAEGTPVCYQREGEGFCRPARIVSAGFTERLPAPGGATHAHALVEYGEPPWVLHEDDQGKSYTPGHTFQTDRHYDPACGPNTWHLPDECPRAGGPGCPFSRKPVWPPPREQAP